MNPDMPSISPVIPPPITPDAPPPPASPLHSKNTLMIVIAVAAFLVILALGIVVFSPRPSTPVTPSPTPMTVPTVPQRPSPTPEVSGDDSLPSIEGEIERTPEGSGSVQENKMESEINGL